MMTPTAILTPTEEQRRIIEAPLAPLRVAAGAGTGKTATIAMRIVHLVTRQGLDPETVVGITFTNKAAAEMADRIRAALVNEIEPGREVEVHTYHGFAAQILAEFGALVGVERRIGIITPTFSRQLLNRVLVNVALPNINPADRNNVEYMRRLGSALGDNLLEPADLKVPPPPYEEGDPWAQRSSLLTGLVAYQYEKARLRAIDYSDLIVRAHQLVTSFPEATARIRDRYQAVMLDEYQDTNPAQRELLRSLFPAGFPVMAVGDVDQTIYEWRGASPHNFEQFPHHFPSPGGDPAPTLPLTENRRSLPVILDVANAIRRETGSKQLPLTPLPGSIGGEVAVSWHDTAVAEADDIGRRLHELHSSHLWKQMAVLFRKNKDMILVHDALRAAGIPVEVANLGGLLGIPEVSDLHAWLRILHAPEDSPALYRLLLGSRYRLGIGDLIHLARWTKDQDRSRESAPDDEEYGPLPGHTLVEAIDHLGEIGGLRPLARAALTRFRLEYRDLLQAAQGVTLVELSRRILDRSGAWDDLIALPDNEQLTARLNLYRFLDLTEEWSPLEGEPSLEAFLFYLETMAEEQSEELDTARLSGEDAVILVTVHRAKGLEWEVVFVPACYQGNFPAGSQSYDNPISSGRYLPYEYRLDRQWLPPIGPDLTADANRALLSERHLEQEWRIAYVAATRAKQRLLISGAWWYGHPDPKVIASKPSALWNLVAQHPASRVDSKPDVEPTRPFLLRYEPLTEVPDPLFSRGWDGALRSELAQPGAAAALAAQLDQEDGFQARLSGFEQMLADLPPAVTPGPETPGVTSVTGLVTYATCPKRFYWSEVDRLPRRPNPAARRGTRIHRSIELYNRGQVPLDDLEEGLYDVPEDVDEETGPLFKPFAVFSASRFARTRPHLTEHPFDLMVGKIRVRGRIDAIYQPSPDNWEIVDFKSGRNPNTAETNRAVQLQAYALAAREGRLGQEAPPNLSVTFAYLGAGLEETTEIVDQPWIEGARDRLHGITDAIASSTTTSVWDPTPSGACQGCDFLQFCPTGKRFQAAGR